MKKQSMLILLMGSLLLTGCDFLNFESSEPLASSSELVTSSSELVTSSSETTVTSSESSEPITSSSEDKTTSSGSDSTSEGSSSSESGLPSGDVTQTPPSFAALSPANLTNFATDRINDPVIPYSEDNYTVKPFPSGFTYPSNARLKPTNAYLEFWHPETNLDLRIIASNEVFKLIEDHGLNENKELYWPVTLQVNMNEKTFTYYEVGMRMKGNTSRRRFVDHNGNFKDNISFKLNFKEVWTKDHYAPFGLQKTWTKDDAAYKVRDDRTFLGKASNGKDGLKKLDIKWNKSEDKSLVIQPFVFSLFQKYGIISQNSTLSTLTYNNTHMGVVTVNEPTDKHLTRRYLPKEATDGDLYKVGWGFGFGGSLRIEDYYDNHKIIGIENKFDDYEPAYDLKEGDETHANLLNLMHVLQQNEGKTPAQYKAALEAVVDMNSFLTYAAIAYLTGNPDDMRNHGNNYYIYFNPAENNKAYFIPYDYDWSMGLMWDGKLDMFGVLPLSNRQELTGDWQKNRLYWYTISEPTNEGRWPHYNITINRDYQNAYIDKVHLYSNDQMYSVSGFNAVYENYKAIYETKTLSGLDSENFKISPFDGTALATSFILDVKNQINTSIPVI